MPPSARIVNTIPSHDRALRRLVDRITDEDPPETPQELEATLRPMFPRVAVFERQLSGERRLFYVYRDGRYEPEDRERWWEAPDVPCARVSLQTGEMIRVAGAWEALLGAPAESIPGRHFSSFVVPAALPAARAMFEAAARDREVRTLAAVARADGTPLHLEVRAVREDSEIVVWLRPRIPARPEALTGDSPSHPPPG